MRVGEVKCHGDGEKRNAFDAAWKCITNVVIWAWPRESPNANFLFKGAVMKREYRAH